MVCVTNCAINCICSFGKNTYKNIKIIIVAVVIIIIIIIIMFCMYIFINHSSKHFGNICRFQIIIFRIILCTSLKTF